MTVPRVNGQSRRTPTLRAVLSLPRDAPRRPRPSARALRARGHSPPAGDGRDPGRRPRRALRPAPLGDRHILSIVRTNSTLAGLELPSDHPARARLDDVDRATDRARGLCRKLLALAHSDEPVRLPIDLNTVVREVMAMARPDARLVAVRFDLSDTLLPVMGDPDELGQVVLNLATNAMNAMDAMDAMDAKSSRGRLTVTTRNVQRPQLDATRSNWACLSVRDTGPGIDPMVLPRIFEPFVTTRSDRGTGLGLAIVQRVVTDHGGFVEVESAPGRGSEFHVFLPTPESA